MGFATVPDAVHAAGTSAGAAVTALHEADCGTPAEAVAAALPGATAGEAATGFAGTWSTSLRTWLDDAGTHARALSAAAASYASGEAHNTDTVLASTVDSSIVDVEPAGDR